MACIITCYNETLNSNKQWEPSNRYSYEMVSVPGNTAWPEMKPNYNERNPALYSLLVMGLEGAYPFSFTQRGFPSNASKEVKSIYDEYDSSHSSSYLTREELESKMGELMILPDQKALVLKSHLAELLQALPAHHGDPKHSRIVFWFTGK